MSFSTVVFATALVGGLSVVGSSEVVAQRRGFIIGFGAGPSVVTWSERAGDRQTSIGVATDLKIGAQIGRSVQVYYSNKAAFSGGEFVDWQVSGVTGLGVTYVLPSAPVHLSGSVGGAAFLLVENGEGQGETGLGFSGGIGYEFADLWIVDLSVVYGNAGEDGGNFNVLHAKLGINILSH